jgi:hypothetical protein
MHFNNKYTVGVHLINHVSTETLTSGRMILSETTSLPAAENSTFNSAIIIACYHFIYCHIQPLFHMCLHLF